MDQEKLKYEVFDPVGEISKKFDLYIKFVVGILFVAVVTMLLMVGSLLLEAFHFNSATYKEYSERVQSVEQMQKSNDILLEQISSQEKQIIQLQQQINDLIRK